MERSIDRKSQQRDFYGNGAKCKKAPHCGAYPFFGAADGVRTHDNWNHNPGLYR